MTVVNLFDICTPKQWKTISTKNLSKSGYPVYGANGIIGFYPEYNHENETLLITCRGATCGSLTISKPKSYVNGNAMALNNLNKNKIDMKYLYYFLKNRRFNDVISGSAQPQITRQGLQKIQIPLPSLEEQKQIVKELDQADELRKKRKQVVALLDDYLKAVFLEMFGDPVVNEKGWEVKTIEEIAKKEKYSIKRGPFGGALKKEIFVKKGYLVYEQFHALNNDFSMARYFINEDKFNELRGFEVKTDDIIISCSGVYLGKLAIVPPNAKKGIINQALLKISLDQEKMNNVLFINIFTNENFKNKFFGNKIGSGIPNFPPMSDFKKFEFICPPIELQNQFAEIVQKTEQLKQSMLSQSKKLDTNFNVLMQEAFAQ